MRSGVSLTKTPIFSISTGSAATISAAAFASIRRVLGVKMKPNASAPAATLACASRGLVVAQILTQVTGQPPAPAILARRRRSAHQRLAHQKRVKTGLSEPRNVVAALNPAFRYLHHLGGDHLGQTQRGIQVHTKGVQI